MKITADGLALIKNRESCRLKAYRCPAGIWTIGYGVTGDWVHEGLEITQEEADTLFLATVTTFDAGVQKTCPTASPCQHSACVSLSYNIGLGNFAKSSVARLHNAERYAEAAQAFALWNKAGGKVLPGLVSRRAAEASLYLQDIPQEQVAAVPNGDGEKPLSKSRGINGGALTGVGTIATVALPSIKSALPAPEDIQSITDGLSGAVSYLPALGYLVAGLTLFGVGLTLWGRWHDRQEGRA